MNPRAKRSGWRWIARIVVLWVIAVVALLVLAALLPGLEIASVGYAFAAVAVVALINALVWPLLLRLLLPFVVLSGGLLVLALNGLVIYLAGQLVAGLSVADGWTAF